MGIFVSITPKAEGTSDLGNHFDSRLFNESRCSHHYKFYHCVVNVEGDSKGATRAPSPQQQEQQQQQQQQQQQPPPPPPPPPPQDLSEEGDAQLVREHSASSGGSSTLGKRRASSSSSSGGNEDPWGWFEDVDPPSGDQNDGAPGLMVTDDTNAGGGVKETPQYILTESLSSQKLWHQTAGLRSRQPSRERAYFENLWESNFSESKVDYSRPLQQPKRSIGVAHRARGAGGAGDGGGRRKRERERGSKKVLFRATSPFGSAVSKSFQCEKCGEMSSIIVHIPKFQIVQVGSDVHAEYLIVVGLGSVSLGVWRRFREFKRLARRLGGAGGAGGKGQFHNALLSWRCLENRQRWFRCLDKDYLILKCFLLERFLHDLVFESMSPQTIRDFLGLL